MDIRPVTSTRARALASVLAASLLLVGCEDDSRPSSDEAGGRVAVDIRVFQYIPGDLEIERGTTVTWTNHDEILHTATSGEPGTLTSVFEGVMEGADTSFSFRFEEPGSYSYFCGRHNGMRGVIRVT